MALTNKNLIDYFIQRMVELFDYNTIDSYSVRTCNTMSILYELKMLIDGWLIGNIKRGETVSRCVEECISFIEKDNLLQYNRINKKYLKLKLDEYKKGVEKVKDTKDKKDSDYNSANEISNLIDIILEYNEKNYIKTLINSVKTVLFTEKEYENEKFSEVTDSLDVTLSLLATELLRRGYSIEFLYLYFKAIKLNKRSIPFEESYDNIEKKLGKVSKYKYVVIIRIDLLEKDIPQFENLYELVPDEYQVLMDDGLKGFVKEDERRRFYIKTVTSADIYSALYDARSSLYQDLDRNFWGNTIIKDYAIVVNRSSTGNKIFKVKYNVNNHNKNNVNTLALDMNNIIRSGKISDEILIRLNTALRHLRVGDNQTEVEQTFLNYWIGLEFIFATPKSGDSTFSRMIEKLPQMQSVYYLKRNIDYLDHIFRIKGLLNNDKSIGDLTDEEIDTLFNNTDSILLKKRIKGMKSNLHSKEHLEKYLEKHNKNMTWHLSRIYYLRNELIHEAAINQNIVGVTYNLRSYLVFVLNLLLDYCKHYNNSKRKATMDSFFWDQQLQWEIIKNNKYDKHNLLEMKFEKILV